MKPLLTLDRVLYASMIRMQVALLFVIHEKIQKYLTGNCRLSLDEYSL